MRISDWSSVVCSSDLNGGSYRNRTAVLGDIVDSQPVYVGAPDSNLFYGKTFTGSSAYATFANGKTSRTPIIWVAANDGMLHGFNASTGAEVYAYLPGAVIVGNTSDTATIPVSRLANLANANYRSEEHTSELQSLMRISYAVFCLKTKKQKTHIQITI